MTWFKAAQQHNVGRWLRSLALSACLASSVSPQTAHAETGQVAADSGVKATVGTALLGAEAVVTVQAAFGVRKAWVYGVGGGIGLVAGGVGGYFIDQAGSAEASMGLLMGGLVFAVPATIAMLNAARFKPVHNPEIDSGATALERAQVAAQLAPHEPVPSLVDVDPEGKLRMKMPAVAIAPVWDQSTSKMYSLPQAPSVRVPVLHWTF